MSREAYTPNLSASDTQQDTSTGATNTTFTGGGGSSYQANPGNPKVHYKCAHCDADCYIARTDPVRCHECGQRCVLKIKKAAQGYFECR